MSEMMKSADEPDHGFVALQWWRVLTGQHPGRKETGKDRAARARLRRASPTDAMCEEATLQLLHALKLSSARLPRVATLAAVLATIREDDGKRPFGRQIGREKITDAKSAKLSMIRFRRLLEAETEEEIATALRRAIAIAGFTVNVRDVTRTLLFWEDEKTKPRLVLDYYGAAEQNGAPADKPAAA